MALKRRYEPAETFSMEEDGFFGELYLPARNTFPGKCLILFGGSAGKFLLTQLVAEQFVDAGMNVLALAYHGAPGLPKFLVEQPVDVIEAAAKHLKRIGYRKVGLWGISMGGCLALLAGSLLPELISCVVSVAPMELVPQGEVRKKPVAESAFCFHGIPLPYAPYVPSDGDAWYQAYRQATRHHKEPYSRELLLECYRQNPNPEAVIPVWDINGPILLLGGERDGMCPTPETFASLLSQLEAHRFSHPVEHHLYPHLGHYVLPVKPATTKLLRAEREFPQECEVERAESWQDTLRFLWEVWQ